MHVAVVANGELSAGDGPSLLTGVDLVIAADGGLAHCVALGRWPDVLVGDLDSAPAEMVQQARERGVTVQAWPADKDATDLEIALAEAGASGATTITVVAPFGGRLDHEVATIGLLAARARSDHDVELIALDGQRTMWFLTGFVELELPLGATLSLVPWGGEVRGVATAGLQWPLESEHLALGTTRGVSNVAVEQHQSVRIDPASPGVLLVVAS